MRVDVFKRTSDCWYPEYECDYVGGLVEVSFTKTGPVGCTEPHWRVCVWGADDIGMEKDFDYHHRETAWACFLEVVKLEDVTVKSLQKMGFISA